MSNRVVETINRMSARVTLKRNPAFFAQVFRKRIVRTAPTTIGGIPTLGGLAVLDSEDEDAIEFDFLGNAKAVRTADFSPSLMMDRQDTHNGSGNEYRFMIEPDAVSGSPGWFDIRNHDIMYVWMDGAGTVKAAFEVVGVEAVNNLAPYSTRYVCNKRADLDL